MAKKAAKKKTTAKKRSPKADYPKPSLASRKMEEKWAIQNAVDTLQRAEELKRDKKMMKKVAAEVSNRQKALESIANCNCKK